MPLRAALVGCGKVADQHIIQVEGLDTVQLVALCDVEPLMAQQVAVRYGVPKVYSDFDQMLAVEKPDVVHITTPPSSHLNLGLKALDAGCHLVVEKPLALSRTQTSHLLGYAEDRGLKVTVGYTHYFDPPITKLRRLVEDGVMGEAVHLDSFFGYNLRGPFGRCVLADDDHWVRKLPGKLFHNVIDHLLNKITEFMPDANPHVQVCSWQRSDASSPALDLPDELRAMIVGRQTSAYATFSAHARPMRHSFTFYGTRNTAHLDFVAGTLTLSSENSYPGPVGRLLCPIDQSRQQLREAGRNMLRLARYDYHSFSGLRHLLSAFYDSVLYDQPVPISYDEIERVSAITDRIFEHLGITAMVAK